MEDRDFPENFVWGAATCPARSEGETMSDWGGLRAPDGSGPDDGPRHWRRYRYDFRAMADLGLKAYRFGCDWGRLQRAPYGALHRETAFRYLEMLAELRGLGIEPWLTLFHDALPRWAADGGGWLNPEAPRWFADFARRLADVTDGEVTHWVTVHEPQVYALSRHAWDAPPGASRGGAGPARAALSRLRDGHRLAAAAVRKRLAGAKVGVALAGGCFFPRRAWHPGDWLAAGVAEWMLNRRGLGGFLRGDGACDFLMVGVGNELGVDAGDALSFADGVSRSVPGRMRHEGGNGAGKARRRRRLAAWIGKSGLPVYLVGNGVADDGETLGEILSAYAGAGTKGGAAGFFYDPLLDQFDPDRGLRAGRGLLRVDFQDRDRRRDPRRVAGQYAQVVRTGRLQPEGRREGRREESR